MSDATYQSQPGDTADAICHKHYGKIDGNLERVHEANPGLADLGAILPVGTRIRLPAVPEQGRPPILQTARLWD